MAQTPNITDRILEEVCLTPACRLDDLVLRCQDFTWQEVFLEVNRLNRIGHLEITVKGLGAFTIHVTVHKSTVGTDIRRLKELIEQG